MLRRALLAATLVLLPTVPANAQLEGGTVEYVYDDGDGDTNQGPPSTFDPDMLWGNYFLTADGGEVITEIAVAFGPTFPSLADGPVTFWLLDDPDMDLDPRNATSLASVQATPDVFNDTFFSVEIPPTPVSGAFFVGVSAQLLGGQDRPARVDTDAEGDRSWFFYAPDIAAVIDDLGSAPFGTRMDNPEFVLFPGAFMIRATGEPGAVEAEATSGLDGFAVEAVYPNPTMRDAVIAFRLDVPSVVRVDVVDGAGRRVAVLADGARQAGRQRVRWTTAGAAPGVYIVRVQAGDRVETTRLTVVGR